MTETFLNQIELSVRAANVLHALNPRMTFDDFMALDKRTVMAQRNAGRRTWQEVVGLQTHFRHLALESADDASAETESLRDRAALAALTALAQRAYIPLDPIGYSDETTMPRVAARIARHSFMIADAFIAARETGEK